MTFFHEKNFDNYKKPFFIKKKI